MRVVTTCSVKGLEAYGHRWIDSVANWPAGTEAVWYTEGYTLPPGAPKNIETRDFADMQRFTEWKASHKGYEAPSWEWDVVRYAHKVFAACDALRDYKGVGVWLDADCITYKPIPEGLIEKQVEGVYLACYQRTGIHTETGLWIVDCNHPIHEEFMDLFRAWYLTDEFKKLPQWTDCHVLDACIQQLRPPVRNLSGDQHLHPHPQAVTELGRYIDHTKGLRKKAGRSEENAFREMA